MLEHEKATVATRKLLSGQTRRPQFHEPMRVQPLQLAGSGRASLCKVPESMRGAREASTVPRFRHLHAMLLLVSVQVVALSAQAATFGSC